MVPSVNAEYGGKNLIITNYSKKNVVQDKGHVDEDNDSPLVDPEIHKRLDVVKFLQHLNLLIDSRNLHPVRHALIIS